MEGAQGGLLPQESPSVLSCWVSSSLDPEAWGNGLVSRELTDGPRHPGGTLAASPHPGVPFLPGLPILWEANFHPSQAHGQVQVHQGFGELTANLEGAWSLCNLSHQEGNSQSELRLTPGACHVRSPGGSAALRSRLHFCHHISPQPLIGPSPSSCSWGGGVASFFLSFFFQCIFWLCWVFTAAWGFSLVAASGGSSLVAPWVLLVGVDSLAAEQGLWALRIP